MHILSLTQIIFILVGIIVTPRVLVFLWSIIALNHFKSNDQGSSPNLAYCDSWLYKR